MTLEDNILSYLDGTLGADQSAELLHTLSASPDKRRLLEEHLRMKDIVALGKRPYAVSPELERTLAARLPAIRPTLESTRRLAPVARSFSRAVAAAGALGILMIAGLLTWYGTRGESIADHRAATQNVASLDAARANSQPVATIETSPGSAGRTLSSTSLHARTVTEAASAGSQHVSATLLPIAGTQNISSPNASLNPSTPQQVLSSNESSLSDQSTDAAPPVAVTSVNAPTSITPMTARELHIQQPGVLTPHTLSGIAFAQHAKTSAIGVGLHFSEMQYTLPRLASDASAQTFLALDPGMTLSYYLSPWFALNVELGLSQYAVVTDNAVPQPSMELLNYSRLIHTTNIDRTSTTWARLGAEYTFNPEDQLPFTIGASGGVALENKTEPIGAVSAGISRTLSSSLQFDLALVGTGIYGSPGSQFLAKPTTDVTGVLYTAASTQRTFMTALGLRAGVRFHP